MCDSDKYLDLNRLCADYPLEIISRVEYNELIDKFHQLYRDAVWSLATKRGRTDLKHTLDEFNAFYLSTK